MYKEQPGKSTSPVYISYLVRLWRSASSPEWLASLEAPGTHERHSFADIASFFAFLQAQTSLEQSMQLSSEQPEATEHSNLLMEPP